MRGIVSCNCIIGQDKFDRADAANLGAAWDNNDPPVAFIRGNVAVIDNTNPQGIVRFLTPHPLGAAGHQLVDCKFKRNSDHAQAQFVVGMSDVTNEYLYAKVYTSDTTGCVVLALVDSADTILSTQAIPESDVGNWTRIKVCWFPDEISTSPAQGGILRVSLHMASGMVYGDQLEVEDNTPYGEYAGIGAVGTSDPWEVEFDNFYFKKAKDEEDIRNCPDCNTPCLIEEDDFATDNPCKWNVVSGLWFRTSGVAQVSGSGGVMLCTVHHPQDKTSHWAQAEVVVNATTPRVIVNADSGGTSYHWAQATVSGSNIVVSIGKDGTTLKTETQPASAGTYALTACYAEGFLTGNLSVPGATTALFKVTAASAEVAGGTYAGLGGGSGGEQFDNFEFQKHYTEPDDTACPSCSEQQGLCSSCSHLGDLNGEAAEILKLTIVGSVGGADGTYFLQRAGSFLNQCGGAARGGCQSGDSNVCCAWREDVDTPSAGWQICFEGGDLRVYKTDGVLYVRFHQDAANDECLEWDDYPVPYFLGSLGGIDFSAAIAYVTALV